MLRRREGGADRLRVLLHLPHALARAVVVGAQPPRLLVDGVEELGLLAVGGAARAVAVVVLCEVEHVRAVVVDELARGKRDARALLHRRTAVDVVAVDAW